MKQEITLEQWNELDQASQLKLEQIFGQSVVALNIGQMIEFLGDDLKQIDTTTYEKAPPYTILKADKKLLGNEKFTLVLSSWEHACDGLFEVVKAKLNK